MQSVHGSHFGVTLPAAGVLGGLPRAAFVAAADDAGCFAGSHRSLPAPAGRSSVLICGAGSAGQQLMGGRIAEIRCDFFASPCHSSVISSSNSACFSRCPALWKRTSSFNIASDSHQQRRFRLRVNANIDLGDFGARDPTATEIESNFGDKVVGNQGTDHIILIPPSLLGLSERSCTPVSAGTACLSEEEAISLLRKVVGWRLLKTDKGLKIWTEWKLKDFGAGIVLFDRIAAVAEAEEHYPDLHLQGTNIARAELSTSSIGGLSMNDFIFAAKVDKIKTSDLVKKNRFWA